LEFFLAFRRDTDIMRKKENSASANRGGPNAGDSVTVALDAGLEFFRQVLALRGYRQQILTADIANASTPGFKGVDLDFRQALATATGDTASPTAPPRLWLIDDARQFAAASGGASGDAAAAVKFQTDPSVTFDGNSVDLNQEKATAAENAVQYEAAATFASQILKMVTTAVGGAGGAGATAS
jgi:flagellar basal-body rod protein FlgB